MKLRVTVGMPILLHPQIVDSGVPVDVTPDAGVIAVKACISSLNGSQTFVAETLQFQSARGADWRNGIVAIEFDGNATLALADQVGRDVRLAVTTYEDDGSGGQRALGFFPFRAEVQKGC